LKILILIKIGACEIRALLQALCVELELVYYFTAFVWLVALDMYFIGSFLYEINVTCEWFSLLGLKW
jgi:hypothetical protein